MQCARPSLCSATARWLWRSSATTRAPEWSGAGSGCVSQPRAVSGRMCSVLELRLRVGRGPPPACRGSACVRAVCRGWRSTLRTATRARGCCSCRTLDAVEDDDSGVSWHLYSTTSPRPAGRSRAMRSMSWRRSIEFAPLERLARRGASLLRGHLGLRTGRKRGRRPLLRQGASRAPSGLGHGGSPPTKTGSYPGGSVATVGLCMGCGCRVAEINGRGVELQGGSSAGGDGGRAACIKETVRLRFSRPRAGLRRREWWSDHGGSGTWLQTTTAAWFVLAAQLSRASYDLRWMVKNGAIVGLNFTELTRGSRFDGRYRV